MRLDENKIKRLEENNKVIYEIAKKAERQSTGTYEEMVSFHLGTISSMLADISKSLAILADKIESEK